MYKCYQEKNLLQTLIFLLYLVTNKNKEDKMKCIIAQYLINFKLMQHFLTFVFQVNNFFFCILMSCYLSKYQKLFNIFYP